MGIFKNIHDKINERSYYTSNIKERALLPYTSDYFFDKPRFYFNTNKKLTFNFKTKQP